MKYKLNKRQERIYGEITMALRTIMIFPYFDNMEIIERIREQYDPLHNLVNPHITLVFPFEDEISNDELKDIIEECMHDINPFELVLHGFSTQENKYVNYLFLKVIRGSEKIIKLHDILYSRIWNIESSRREYTPHMTVGKFRTVDKMNEAYSNVKDISNVFETIVNKISVEMVGENEESIIIMEKTL